MYSKKPKIVITDCDHPSVEFEKEIFKQIDSELILENCKTEEDVIAVASDADGILNQYAPITEKVITSLQNCKIISRYGVGVDNVDVEAATKHNIIVANVPDYCVDEVSTHAL
ncbi:MAG: C-terminal binding protein, partial [Atribacterota bacterium]